MRLFLLLGFSIVFWTSLITAQNGGGDCLEFGGTSLLFENPDSLLKIIVAKGGTLSVQDEYLAGSALHFSGEYETAKIRYAKAAEMAVASGDMCYYYWSRIYYIFSEYRLGRIKLAERHFRQLGDTLKTQLEYEFFKIKSDHMLGSVYYTMGKLDKAQALFQQTLEYAMTHNDDFLINLAHYDIAALEFRIGRFDAAIDAYKKCLDYYEEMGYFKKALRTHANIIGCGLSADSSEIVEYYFDNSKKYDHIYDLPTSAQIDYYRAIHIRKSVDLYDPRVDSLFAEALLKYELAGSKEGTCIIWNNIANTHKKRGEIEQTLASYKKAYFFAGEYGLAKRQEKASEELYKQYKETNVDSALYYLEECKRISSDILNVELQHSIVELTETLEVKEKEKELAESRANHLESEKNLQSQKNKTRLAGVGILGILFITYFAIRSQKQKRASEQKQYVIVEQQARQEVSDLIQKHRYETLLATIQGEESERDRLAKEVHDGVGGTLSGIAMQLESLGEKGENLKVHELAVQLRQTHEDLRKISHNMAIPAIEDNTLVELTRTLLLNIKSGHNVEVSLVLFPPDKPMTMNDQLEVGLYRILQELTTNSLKHGQCKNLDVQLTKTDDVFILVCEDDGKGFDSRSTRKGIGLKNITERVEVFGGTFDVDSRKGRGTIVSITIPQSNS